MNSSYPFSLSEMARIEYESAMVEERYSAGRRDYGTGDLLTHAEVHALAEVGGEPGITVLALAARTCRTKGAMSQLLAKLTAKGLLERKACGKNVALFLTPHGLAVTQAHSEYDLRELKKALHLLETQFSVQELASFYRVLQAKTALMRGQLSP